MSVAELPGQQGLHLLYSDHHGWLKGWLYKRLGNAADAADMAHDVFLRLLAKPASRGFSSPVDARAYLCAMARGMCVDLWRRREVERAWLDTLAAQPEPFEPSPEFRMMVIETILEIGAVLARLSDKAQKAFVTRRGRSASRAAPRPRRRRRRAKWCSTPCCSTWTTPMAR